ncbi:hypothetical protein SBRY_40893 [Actinacidiphila bryophytorum]|uniref:Uncharacterized protein n=1 Tax=Actinacidiphila bryophytorum TaxID=1436133 RepID=A0A9W4MDX0_9ACTN|nr:hypothetical protein SBRY_40893 [Actinacidiphila bryophytorum]
MNSRLRWATNSAVATSTDSRPSRRRSPARPADRSALPGSSAASVVGVLLSLMPGSLPSAPRIPHAPDAGRHRFVTPPAGGPGHMSDVSQRAAAPHHLFAGTRRHRRAAGVPRRLEPFGVPCVTRR